MPLWDVVMGITVLGVGNIGPQQKLVKRQITAATLSDAITLAIRGLVTVKILSAQAVDPQDPAIPDVPL